jgi:HSP20 family protein
MLPMRRPTRRFWDNPLDLLRRDWGDMDWLASATPEAACLVDIREDDNNVYVEAEMPGFTRDQIQVSLEGGMLHISAERPAAEVTGQSHLAERRYTQLSRSFTLPIEVDQSKIDARLDHGVLHLILPKSEKVKARRIEVKGE